MIFVKKLNSDKLISAMTVTLFALLLAEAYLNHKDEIDESIARLKTVLGKNNEKGDAAENAE